MTQKSPTAWVLLVKGVSKEGGPERSGGGNAYYSCIINLCFLRTDLCLELWTLQAQGKDRVDPLEGG